MLSVGSFDVFDVDEGVYCTMTVQMVDLDINQMILMIYTRNYDSILILGRILRIMN